MIALVCIPWIRDFEGWTIDQRFAIRGSVKPDERIVIVGIDQATIKWASRPMFAWGPLYAELSEILIKASADCLMFDLIFSSSTESSIRKLVKEILQKENINLPRRVLKKISFERKFRAAILKAEQSSLKIVLGFAWEAGQPISIDKSLMTIVPKNQIGFFNLGTDTDGVIRDTDIYAQNKAGEVIPSVSLAVAKSINSDINYEKHTDKYINYVGPRGSFRTISLKELISSADVDKLALASKTILVGFTDITDFKKTPYGFMPGVEVHANLVDNILNNRFIKKVSISTETVILCFECLILLVSGVINSALGILLALVFIIGWVIACIIKFEAIALPMVSPVLAAFFIGGFEVFALLRKVSLEKKKVTKIFSRYVSDSVLKEILTNPVEDFLKGKRRDLGVMFIDIRGFTAFSEKNGANEVVDFLNNYFSKLTDIILKHDGVVDKFLGDGLLAFFNAPVAKDNYLKDAVLVAKEILEFSASEEFLKLTNQTQLKVGIAIHGGTTVFGNIGSEKKAEFTVIGDTVNTTSRLETLNKDYNTQLIVSNIVRDSCPDEKWEYLGKIDIRGKQEKVDIFTLKERGNNNA